MLLPVIPLPQFLLGMSLNPLHSRCPLLPELSCQPHYLQPTLSLLPSSIPECDHSFLQTAALPEPPTGAICATEHQEDVLPDVRMSPCGADRRCGSPVPLSAVHLQLSFPHSPLCWTGTKKGTLKELTFLYGSTLEGGTSHNLCLPI